ncbi:Cytochrome c1 1 heme protein mitochondrial [Zea mays]|uniref:Cytochrome c1 1 heme protein mitochondrial n=1 Tax=Zea mays TaxID=4577 RepID=A0A1D6KMS4_MAIZE|nr:Cytochrome c1 1 heme protein mitochondrial [Zea mays]
MTRRNLATASSTSRNSPTWSHVPLCTTSSGAVVTWTRCRAAAPRCPWSSRGPHGRRQRRRLSGCSGHRIRRRCHHIVQLIVYLKPTCHRSSAFGGATARGTTLLMNQRYTSFYNSAKSHQYSVCRAVCRARSTTTISRTVASSWRRR